MGWLNPEDNEDHGCPLPSTWESGIHVGDLWRCDECWIVWEVKKIDTGSTNAPISPPQLRWRRYRKGQPQPVLPNVRSDQPDYSVDNSERGDEKPQRRNPIWNIPLA